MKIVNPEDLRTSAAPVASCEPESRSEAQLNIDHKKLMLTGKDVQKRGTIVILTFAGRRDPGERSIALSHRTGKAAKTTQTLVRRELRNKARDDSSYNRVLQSIVHKIVHLDQREDLFPLPDETVIAPPSVVVLPTPAKIVHLHQCNAPSAGQCKYNWSRHDTKTSDGSDCFCKPGLDDTNLTIDGTRFVIHESSKDCTK